jgi:hypothetical protein
VYGACQETHYVSICLQHYLWIYILQLLYPGQKYWSPSHQPYKQRTFARNEHSTDNNSLARSGKMRSSQFLLKICLKVFKAFFRKI